MEINIPVVQKPNLFVRYLDDEVIVSDIDHTGQYALNAVTSTSREHKCLEYLRENVSELETLLEDFSPLVSDTMITFYDTNGPYNGSPGVKSSTVQVDNRLRVKLNLGDVSRLCHELAHVNDLSRGNSTSNEFQQITTIIRPKLEKVYELLHKRDFVFFDTSVEQETYESDTEELYAVIMNDWYQRTHEPNIFADKQSPLVSEIVVDLMYRCDEQYRTPVDDYFSELTKWSCPHQHSTCDLSNIPSREEQKLQEVINELKDWSKYQQNTL